MGKFTALDELEYLASKLNALREAEYLASESYPAMLPDLEKLHTVDGAETPHFSAGRKRRLLAFE